MRWNRHERKLERRLRQERPRPSDRLVRSIRADVTTGRQRLLRTIAALPSTLLTVVVLLGLLAVGGLGFATSSLTNTLTHIGNSVYIPELTTLRIDVVNAGNAQYGTTSAAAPAPAPKTTTTTTKTTPKVATTAAVSTATTTATTSTLTVATTTVAATGTTSVSLSFALTPPTSTTVTTNGTTTRASTPTASGGSIAPATVQASIPPQAFASAAGPVTLAASHPPAAATSHLTGQNNVAFTVTATTGTGGSTTDLHKLNTYITFTVTATCGYRPAVYENGGWRAMNAVSASPTVADLGKNGDGYSVGPCVNGVQTYSLYTAHLSTFGIVAPQNLGVSESGRKLKKAGSGKFGDPLLIHPGPPALRILKAPIEKHGKVSFSYFVDEQVAAYLHVISGRKQLPIVAVKSVFRGHRIGGKTRKTIHIAELRPGTAHTILDVAALKPGSKLVVTVIDYDGNKVRRTVKIK